MKYISFIIENYKAIVGPLTIDLSKYRLMPLIGANECGKTSILQAIYAFDFTNDEEYNGIHINGIRNYYDPIKSEQDTVITAVIKCTKKEILEALPEKLQVKYADLDNFKELSIKRVFSPKGDITKYEIEEFGIDSEIVGKEIVKRLPYIVYNDDFTDRPETSIDIPNETAPVKGWYGIYERAFLSGGHSLQKLIKEKDENIRKSAVSDVVESVNKMLIKEWSKVSIDDSTSLSIDFDLDAAHKKLNINLVEKVGKKARYFELNNRSKGFLWFYNFVMKIKFNPKNIRNNSDIIYLLDEPGSYLHMTAQEKLCKMLKDISSKDGHVVYCTHSHHLLNPEYIPTKYIYIVKKNKKKEIIVQRAIDANTRVKKSNEMQPVFEALGIANWDFFTQKQRIIMVEGIYDKYALENVLMGKLKDYVVFPGSNASSLFFQLPQMIAYGKSYAVIWDNDKAGRKECEKAIKAYKSEEKHFILLPADNTNNRRMEEMFTCDDMKTIAKILELPENTKYENLMMAWFSQDDKLKERILKSLNKETTDRFSDLLLSIEKAF